MSRLKSQHEHQKASPRRLAVLWYMGHNTAEIARKVGLPEHEVDRRLVAAKRAYPREGAWPPPTEQAT